MTSSEEEFDADLFETRLENLKDTQDGITQMSTWCLSTENRVHHKKIVASWLNVLKRVRIENRLTLFHLANDVIQYSKRRRLSFVESWGTALQKATTMVRDQKVKGKIARIFKIWGDRRVYSEEYLSDLNGLLNIQPPKSTQKYENSSDDFHPQALIADIKDTVRLGNLTDKTFNRIPKEPCCDLETLKSNIKDRHNKGDTDKEIDSYVESLQLYIASLRNELRIRKSLIKNLSAATPFYQTQRGEVKVVVNAYKHFGNRIKSVRKKLDEVTPTLPSPIPSPDINAPSPDPDDDRYTFNFPNANGTGSFMNKKLPFNIDDFHTDENKPIEVIASRSDESDHESYNPSEIYVPKPQSDFKIPGLSCDYVSESADQHNIIPQNDDMYSVAGENMYSAENNNSFVGTNYDAMFPTDAAHPMPVPHPTSSSTVDFNSTWNMDMTWMSNSFNDSGNQLDTSTEYVDESSKHNEYVPTCANTVLQDVDHRQLLIPTAEKQLNQARSNLISLTGSPKISDVEKQSDFDNENIWKQDTDFRTAAMKLKAALNKTENVSVHSDIDYRIPPLISDDDYIKSSISANYGIGGKIETEGYDPADQIESIDMDMSDDDNHERKENMHSLQENERVITGEVDGHNINLISAESEGNLVDTSSGYYEDNDNWKDEQYNFQNQNAMRYPQFSNQQNNFQSQPPRQPYPNQQHNQPRGGFGQREFFPNYRMNPGFRGNNHRGQPFYPRNGRGANNFNAVPNRGFYRGRGSFKGGNRW